MQVMGIFCSKCHMFIYSRAQHDFVRCDCGGCFVDGGQSNTCSRIGANIVDGCIPISVRVDIDNTTMEKLYRDWNKNFEDYGRLHMAELETYNIVIVRNSKILCTVGETRKVRALLWLKRKMLDGRVTRYIESRLTNLEKAYIALYNAAEKNNK